jgi:HAE1 family hydrophobic/amphiphilic exporter-1
VDRAEFQINFKSAPDASLVETRDRVEAILSELRKLREVRSTFATIGAGDAGTVRDGMVYVKLSEKKERKRRQDEVQKEVRSGWTIPGILPRSSRWAGSPGRSRSPSPCAGRTSTCSRDTRRT